MTEVEIFKPNVFVFLFASMWVHLGVSFSISAFWRSVALGENHQL